MAAAADFTSPGAATVRSALANLRKLHSFEYTLAMRNSGFPEVHGEFSGRVFLPDTEERAGYWGRTGDDSSQFAARTPQFTVPVRLLARGETEYSLEDSAWTARTRSSENDFLVQIERVLSLDSCRPPQKKGSYFFVSFTPNLPFLDPAQTHRLIGTIRIRRDRMLIEQVSATSVDSTLSWQADLTGFDKATRMAFPFVRQWRAGLSILSENVELRDTTTLRSRFRLAGYETQFEPGGDSLAIYLERETRDDLLRFLIAPGGLLLGLGRVADADRPAPVGFRRIPLAADSTQAMILERTIAGPDAWKDVTPVDSLAEPAVALTLTKAGQAKLAELAQLENSGSNWVLVLDDRVVAFAPIQRRANPARLTLGVSGTRLMAKHVAIFSQTGALGSIYRLTSLARAR
jgi:hypothetical protein